MIRELQEKAYSDSTEKFWNENTGTFSANENISSPSIASICSIAIKTYETIQGADKIKKG